MAATLAAALLSVTGDARAAQTRVAILKSSGLRPFQIATEAISAALEDLPSQPEVLTFDLAGDASRAGPLLAEIQALEPRVLVTVGSLATSAALKSPSSIPVIFCMVLYPRQSGFAPTSSRTVTGVALDIPLDVQFAHARRLLPDARRLGVLHHPGETGFLIEEARASASRHGFTLQAETVSGEGEVLAKLESLLPRIDVLWTVADSHVMTPRLTSAILLAALHRRVPVLGLSPAHVRSGALAALSCDYEEAGTKAGRMAERMLQGADARTIAVESPERVALALNLVVAKNLGLRITPALEQSAAEVVR